jgi:hypothetical protein
MMREDTKPDPRGPASDPQAAAPATRRPYQSPVLVEYGSVAKLTRGSLSLNSDSVPGNRKSPSCL